MAKYIFLLAVTCLFQVVRADNEEKNDTLMLSRVFNYISTVDTAELNGTTTYSYIKSKFEVERRNIALLPVPSMYRVAHGPRRKYISESYYRSIHHNMENEEVKRMVFLTTIPHHKIALPTIGKFLRPKIYSETIIEDYILSPFCRTNKRFYKYNVIFLPQNKVNIYFQPRIENTQLVKGSVVVDSVSGRIISGYMNGEYDMVSFHLTLKMGDKGAKSFYPVSCDLMAKFEFIGNRIAARFSASYDLTKVIDDHTSEAEDMQLMSRLRTKELRPEEIEVYREFYGDSVQRNIEETKKERSWAKRVFWDTIGEHLLQKTTGYYGTNDQGYVRINPLFNPLYMGYSRRKGFYYKFDIRTTFSFSENSFLFARFKAGYSFKQKQFYYQIPIEYHYNRRKHGYIELFIGNGNWIKNAAARENALANLSKETESFNIERMEFFKDFQLKLLNNYDVSDKLSFQVGLIAHHRDAVEKYAYRKAGVPVSYRSVAPMLEVSLRPMGWKGPILNLDWERSIKGFMNADMAYERWEADLQYIFRIHRLRNLSFRGGFGLYTLIDGSKYFLDYTNFRDNNIPGGWNDEWTGEFELLSSDQYNLSRYYVRSNLTYECPLLFLSWMPLVGHFIEKERLYGSALIVPHLHPYTEFGYGFTTRWVSVAIFSAFRNGKYDGLGAKIGLELFRQW
ncbi:DUF5686 family protein [Prevotella sp. KH2C16]|uniref:DUF5686 family protein n=1 Tax=Prevotella sp. KH2C16 TaxID=1855325 RepID=UPI0008F239B1|nr:DUF5686 family protein [Prevotella sp. KH2C16]SFG12501.1 hypothetical protein SAMN05216383_105159 [Prevotella sp. KH2C16]